MYYPSSENKGADQLRSYCEADLRLCFRLGKNPVFSRCGSFQHYTTPHDLLSDKSILYNDSACIITFFSGKLIIDLDLQSELARSLLILQSFISKKPSFFGVCHI